MGQAKRRGPIEDRIVQSIQRKQEELAASIKRFEEREARKTPECRRREHQKRMRVAHIATAIGALQYPYGSR
jgi:phosphopantetheinyl transferase